MSNYTLPDTHKRFLSIMLTNSMRTLTRSKHLFRRAKLSIPGGVNSPVRAFSTVGGSPPFIVRGSGAYIYDADGNEWLDYVGSWGPMILGHAHPDVVSAVRTAAGRGLSFGAPTETETELAEAIKTFVPSVEMVRLVNSGTEAAMSAIRLARGCTGRDKIIKFEGCYHGHADHLLVAAGSGVLALGTPDSAGVPRSIAADTFVATYNDAKQLGDLFDRHGETIAAVIVEPIAGNMNYVPATPEFLAAARELCSAYQSVLIFDEIMTGFRVAAGGAQALSGIKPDLTTLGKVIGGGLPLAAFGGRRDIMEQLAPLGSVYQAGTLSGNPVAAACGLATLKHVSTEGFFERLDEKTQHLCAGLRAAARAGGISFHCAGRGGMFGFLFTPEHSEKPVERFSEVRAADRERFCSFHQGMSQRGVYLAPSPYEAAFVSGAHSTDNLDATIAAAREIFTEWGN